MNIQHLLYAVEVERTGSISQAAENLYMGQPNLSKAIKELESILNITIFKRTPKGVQVTAKGKEFLHYARNILAQFEEMESLGRTDGSDAPSLRVAIPRASYIVNAFTSFVLAMDSQKAFNLDFCETNALNAISCVGEGRYDLVIIRCRTEYQSYFYSLMADNRLECKDLLSFRYQLLMSEKNPLAQLDVVPYADLTSYIEILHGDTSLPQMSSNTVGTECGCTPGSKKIQVYERGSQFDLLVRVPNTYIWVSPMPQELLTRNKLVQRPCEQSFEFKDILAYQKNHHFTKTEKEFLSHLEDSVKSILP